MNKEKSDCRNNTQERKISFDAQAEIFRALTDPLGWLDQLTPSKRLVADRWLLAGDTALFTLLFCNKPSQERANRTNIVTLHRVKDLALQGA